MYCTVSRVSLNITRLLTHLSNKEIITITILNATFKRNYVKTILRLKSFIVKSSYIFINVCIFVNSFNVLDFHDFALFLYNTWFWLEHMKKTWPHVDTRLENRL